jgi:hypothetical protein
LLPGSLGNRRTVPEGFAVSDDNETNEPRPLHPNEIVRKCDGPKYFGYGHTEIDAKIKSGEIEAPIALSESGRAKGWTGQQIINHQQRLFSRKS